MRTLLTAHKLANYCLLQFQRVLGLKKILGNPYYIVLDPTSYCQLDCPFCGREERPVSTMKFSDFAAILEGLGKTCTNLELYNWGEPFLNKEILEMIRHASSEYGIFTRISSNLNIDKPDLYRELVSSGLNWLTISLDGASQATYEKYRVKGSFDTVVRNIKILVARKRELRQVEPKLVWQFLVFRHNEHEIEMAKQMAKELGVDEIAFRKPNLTDAYRSWDSTIPRFSSYAGTNPVNAPTRADHIVESATASDEASDVASDVASDEATESVSATEHQPQPQLADRPPQSGIAAPSKSKCNWPYGSIVINANRGVSACCGLAAPADDFGDLSHEQFAEIWNNDLYQTARRAVHEHTITPSSPNTCARCDFKGDINMSPNLLQLIYYTLPWLRRGWMKRQGLRIKSD